MKRPKIYVDFAFIHNNKTVVCNTGKMYDISSGSIKEIEQPFEFVVGTVM